MAVSVTQVVGAQIEKVRDKIQVIFEQSNQLAGKVKRDVQGRVEVSRWLYRIPLQQYRGGNFHKINADGGSLGVGTGMQITYLTAGYFTAARSYRVTDEQKNSSDTSEKSIVNVFQKTLSDAMLEAQIDDDITLHTDGTGVLTNQSSASASTTLTFNGSTDTLNINRLREGMVVDVWDATLANKRAPSSGTQPTVIESINYSSYLVTLSQAIASITTTDVLAIRDLDVYGPTTLTSFSSTWPGGGLTNGPGLTGDSFRHGMYYVNDATTSNYYLTKLKSTIPQLLPTRVNAASSAFTFAMPLQVLDGIIQKRDKDAVKGLEGVAHMAQRRQVFQMGVNISNWNRGQTSDKMPDLMPSNVGYDDTFDMAGINVTLSKRQYKDRIDILNWKNWMRVEQHPIRFKEVGGQTVFPCHNSSGEILTMVEFHIMTGMDWCCVDPACGGYVDSLALPS